MEVTFEYGPHLWSLNCNPKTTEKSHLISSYSNNWKPSKCPTEGKELNKCGTTIYLVLKTAYEQSS